MQSAALAGDVSLNQVRAIDGVLTELPPTLTDAQRDKAEQVLLPRPRPSTRDPGDPDQPCSRRSHPRLTLSPTSSNV